MIIMTVEFCDHKLEISGWNFKVRLLLQVSLKLLCLQLASGSVQASCINDGEPIDPQAPGCLDDCEGRRFFLGRDGMCKMCVQCEPGFKHDKYCGDGESGDAICIPCPKGHYSYNRYECLACRVCENTLLTQECSATFDRQCGECLPGFYRDPQNPDLCNQRCEWLKNQKTNPACQAWLSNQQTPTQSASVSQMSSFPAFPVSGNGGVSLTVIIIVCLVVVLISGSAIPVYLCCKRCKKSRDSKATKDIESRTGQSREQLEAADVPPVGCHNSEDECRNGDGPIVNGINDVGVGMVLTNPIATDVSEVVRVLPVSTVQEQVDGGGSVENERSMGSSVIGPDENELRPVSLGSEVAPQNKVTRGGDDEHDGSREELESLLPDAQVKHHHGEADEEKLRGLADAEKPQPTKMEEKDGPSKNDCGLGMSNKPQTVRGKESTVISHENGEHMPTSSESEKTKRNVGGAENEGEDVGKTGREGPDERQSLLTDKQVREHDGRAIWRGSAEAEKSRPTIGEKDASRETKSAKRGKRKKRQHIVNNYFTGPVDTIIMGDQIHHNSAEHPLRGNTVHLNEDSEADDDDEDDDEKEEEEDDDEEEEEGEEDKVSSDTK